MQLTDRQEQILTYLRDEGRVTVEGLSSDLDVTCQTIRRDLGELCALGLAARVRGGARPLSPIANREYRERRLLHAPAKHQIGRHVASLIPNSCSIMLNIGTTTERVANSLSQHKDLRVVTNNANIINILIRSAAHELILVGGSVRPSDGAILGEDAIEFISRYKAEYAVVGASALDPDGAILDFDSREVSVARSILKNSRTRILACDSSKFEQIAPVRICDIEEIDIMVTDKCPPREFTQKADRGGTEIIVTESYGDSDAISSR
ncbi:MAG: DeoR/GlpR family DNA-binding transcription regulator [Aestuariivita sp.]|nr:DeoR/GlpR family DNA-binding transcription regulator [Aestuariivita sp.]MCY4203764.1 DeoR/GlpR family DNA-binding transcription regulator [Aestuariivita sp.]MCY4287073.1 DeoR/GlpR family DNA-binding transcription regulator [Aestuariivita sp.]MCY4345468.1 DeoR/GlpR family DNA-binding transcription regulator [Aestuariivita sp.]